MKALPKRKGNHGLSAFGVSVAGLNESPSQKEGKFDLYNDVKINSWASMKALPKRKGNLGFWSLSEWEEPQ